MCLLYKYHVYIFPILCVKVFPFLIKRRKINKMDEIECKHTFRKNRFELNNVHLEINDIYL